jgi:hypothetical protein
MYNINWLWYPFCILKHEKYAIFVFFNENMVGKLLGFDRMHENKTLF